MVLSKSLMKQRAKKFIEVHEKDHAERSEAQLYWRDFFDIFDIDVKKVMVFEEAIKKYGGEQGYIDAFWKGKLLIEHKSLGKDLDKAMNQAIDYLDEIKPEEQPRYIIVSDFQRIRVKDLNTKKENEIHISDLPENLNLFNFILPDSGFRSKEYDLNLEASRLLANIHDELLSTNYPQNDLELFMVRILFCLYAEDTGIFNPEQFRNFILQCNDITRLGQDIQHLFRILDTKKENRQTNLPFVFIDFPYVNGKLFEEKITPPVLNENIKKSILEASDFDWRSINPSIFGSLFQNVVDPEVRRYLGAHYTSEENILKVINSLFLDELWIEFDKAGNNEKKLKDLHAKIGDFKFFDPACGCGNFLIVTYRELRNLEFAILKKLLDSDNNQSHFEIDNLIKIRLENFYGIEIEEFPARVAQVAMWFTEHQMDMEYESLSIHKNNLPLKDYSNILIEDALKVNWKHFLPPNDTVYILSNPPFVGKSNQKEYQKEALNEVFKGYKNIGKLDYVAAWYKKAAEYIQKTNIEVCLVSTNSICQGSQVPVLWKILKEDYGININFAHQTFKWSNESKNKASVFVIIIGFSIKNKKEKYLFSYEKERMIKQKVEHINGYLMNAEDIFIESKNKPLSNVKPMCAGSKIADGQYLLLSSKERDTFIKNQPETEQWIRPYIGGKTFLKNTKRYCLWLKDIGAEIKKFPQIYKRTQLVKEFRLKSKAKSTRDFAQYPSLFKHENQPKHDYLFIPQTSSHNRSYVPMGFFSSEDIVSNSGFFIENANLYDFGILNSKIHMVWLNFVGGKLKEDYRYSNTLVYNTFPFPDNVSEKQKENIMDLSQVILDIRKKYNVPIGELYNIDSMPVDLKKAHHNLDKAVDRLYSKKGFKSDKLRLIFLIKSYNKLLDKKIKN